jgi:hypothetical protein
VAGCGHQKWIRSASCIFQMSIVVASSLLHSL